MDFVPLTCGIFAVFRWSKRYYARHGVAIVTLCRRMKIFAFQLTANTKLVKGTLNAIKSVWEPKEGGNVKL